MSKLSDTIKDMAYSAGACGKVMDAWTDEMTDDSMVRLFAEQSNFCLSEGVPSISFIREHFCKEILRAHNIYIDECVTGIGLTDNVILLGDCHGVIEVNPWKVVDIQISGCTKLEIKCGKNSIVHVGMFNGSSLNVDSSAINSVAYVHLYSDEEVLSAIGDVRSRRVTL